MPRASSRLDRLEEALPPDPLASQLAWVAGLGVNPEDVPAIIEEARSAPPRMADLDISGEAAGEVLARLGFRDAGGAAAFEAKIAAAPDVLITGTPDDPPDDPPELESAADDRGARAPREDQGIDLDPGPTDAPHDEPDVWRDGPAVEPEPPPDPPAVEAEADGVPMPNRRGWGRPRFGGIGGAPWQRGRR